MIELTEQQREEYREGEPAKGDRPAHERAVRPDPGGHLREGEEGANPDEPQLGQPRRR